MALPIWTKYMNKVYADPSLGYDQDEKFQLPEGYDPCRDTAASDTIMTIEEPVVGLDDLFN